MYIVGGKLFAKIATIQIEWKSVNLLVTCQRKKKTINLMIIETAPVMVADGKLPAFVHCSQIAKGCTALVASFFAFDCCDGNGE